MAEQRLVVTGSNYSGECCLPGFEAIAAPTAAPLESLPDGKLVAQTAEGSAFTLLLASDGELWAAGGNYFGQLGRTHRNNYDPDNRILRRVTGFGGERVTRISAGFYHGAALMESGQLFVWGSNSSGQCGTGAAGGSVLVATRCAAGALADDVLVVFVACGGFHTVALTSDGGVIVFGYNVSGQLGTGNTAWTQSTPERLTDAMLDGVRIVGCAAGDNYTILVSDEGRVFAMGGNSIGQLGLQTF